MQAAIDLASNAYYQREWPFAYYPCKNAAFTKYTDATAWPPYPGGGRRQ